MLDLTRIKKCVDVRRLRRSCVAVVGIGGGTTGARQLARCGVGEVRVLDKDIVGAENICRQDFAQHDVGKLKVDVTADFLRAINPAIRAKAFPLDITKLTPPEERDVFAGADLVMGLTDNHDAQSAASRYALKYGAAYISVGIYPGGVGGEVFFMRKGDLVCYRCMFPHRYKRHADAAAEGRTFDPPSDGATVMAGAQIDSTASDVVLGILTDGADNRYGRLLSRLGNRQLIVVKLDPDWETSPGRDIVRDELGVTPDNAFYFSYNTIAMAPEPDAVANRCPDCRQFRSKPMGVPGLLSALMNAGIPLLESRA